MVSYKVGKATFCENYEIHRQQRHRPYCQLEVIYIFIFLTGSTGFLGLNYYSHRFPDESDEKQSASGRKKLTIHRMHRR
jgi:hypothetical protein